VPKKRLTRQKKAYILPTMMNKHLPISIRQSSTLSAAWQADYRSPKCENNGFIGSGVGFCEGWDG
jgi:hypothetical protein